MKCTHCGFTYDNEPVCPICGTPAPYAATEHTAYRPQPTAPRHAQAAPSALPKTKEAAPKAAAVPKGLLIAALCVLSVIAAALLAGAFMQALTLAHTLRGAAPNSYSEWSEVVNDSDFPDKDIAAKAFDDNTVRKVGEAYAFEDGALCLKSVKLTGAVSALDKNARQMACTVVLTNTGKRTQSYYWPGFSFDDSAFDEANYLYSETDQGSKEFFTLAPGKSLTAVFYYRLPKDSQTLRCTVSVCGFYGDSTVEADSGDFTAAATYQFETKNVK